MLGLRPANGFRFHLWEGLLEGFEYKRLDEANFFWGGKHTAIERAPEVGVSTAR